MTPVAGATRTGTGLFLVLRRGGAVGGRRLPRHAAAVDRDRRPRAVPTGTATLAALGRALAVVLLLVVLPAASALLAACGSGGGAEQGSGAEVVARVDGHDVTRAAVETVRAEARLEGREMTAAAALEEALRRELLRQEAQRLGVSAAAAAVRAREAALAARMGGEPALTAALTAAGMSRTQLRDSLRDGLLREAVRDRRFAAVRVSAAAARRFYERRRATLFTTPASVDLGAFVVRNEGIAGNALARLAAGQPFPSVARQFSVDPQLKNAGGRMGWVTAASLPAALRRAVRQLRVGEVSPPVAAPGGVWVLKLYGRRPARVVPFARVRDDLVAQLTARARDRALAAWLEKALAAARVERL